MRRLPFLISMTAAVVLATPSAIHAAAANTAQMVGGTVKSIPQNTVGSLDATGASELRFQYGKSVFALPYQNITNTQVGTPDGRHLWRVPVPALGKGSRLLTITFREGDATRMLTFRAPARTITQLASTIDDRREGPKKMAAKDSPVKTQAATPKQEDWWGDRYWKTNRNKGKWPSTESEAPGVPAGTKE